MGNLTVSVVSWDSFNVSWTIETGEFEGFVIEVVNLEGGPERQNLTLSGDALSLFMSGLSPSSSYGVSLYGLHKGSLLGPVYTEATTGIDRSGGVWQSPPFIVLFLSLISFFSPSSSVLDS